MSFTAFALVAFSLFTSVAMDPVANSSSLPTAPVTTPAPLAPTPTLVTPLPYMINLSQPLLPGLVNSLLLSPLVNFNNRLSEVAESIPETFAQSGQRLGSVIIRPIQLGTSTANNVATRLNDSLISLSNTTSLVQPILMAPVTLISQVNSALANATTSAINATTHRVGSTITNVGETIANAGQDVQHLGGTIMSWVQSLEQLRQQLAGNTTTSSPSATPTASTTQVITEATPNSQSDLAATTTTASNSTIV